MPPGLRHDIYQNIRSYMAIAFRADRMRPAAKIYVFQLPLQSGKKIK